MNNNLELIKVETNENNEPIVGGRELHEALEIKTPYTQWFDRMCEYGFVENIDYCTVSQKCETNNPRNPYTTIINHAIKLDMAKEIAMIQRSETGKKVRQYFIQVEKDFNSPEKIMARALKIAEIKLNTLQIAYDEMKPKALFAEAVETAHTSILVGDMAKLIKQNGYDIGQNRFFSWLRENGYLCNKKGDMYNMPTQKAMNLELFEVKERTINEPNGAVHITKTPKITGKGQVYFINKFMNIKNNCEVA